MDSFELSTFVCLGCSNFFASLQSFSVDLFNTENKLQGLVGAPQRPFRKRVKAPPSFTCDDCDDTFNVRTNLLFHRKRECPERNLADRHTKNNPLRVSPTKSIGPSSKVPARQQKRKIFGSLPCGYRGCSENVVDFHSWRVHQVRTKFDGVWTFCEVCLF